MSSPILVDATDLATWANRRRAQATLPKLVRRLIHATVEDVQRAGFRAGDGVQLGGWDGIVVVAQGNAFVPGGVSVWESGSNRRVKSKADQDYEKRKADPLGIDPAESTYVCVTLRRWPGKDTWATDRQVEGFWRDVRAYDADDLETWLELAPAVHVWLSILTGKHPEGVLDLDSFWQDWSAATDPKICPEFVLCGRSQVVEAIHDWLRGQSATLAVQAESREEALAVLVAALGQLPEEERVAALSRAAIVRSPQAWSHVTASDKPLILVQDYDDRRAVGRAARAGHRVVVPLGRADSTHKSTLQVLRLAPQEAAQVLVGAGVPEDRARDLAILARRSLTALRRELALSPETQQPAWARPEHAQPLVPVMLAGSWDDAVPGDREAVARLAQARYEQVEAKLVRQANEPDPRVHRVGSVWSLVSREDAWRLLARYLTRADLEHFADVALEVLGIPDPSFDLPADQRWMAPVLGHPPRHSRYLQRGMADTLAIMGARGGAQPLPGGVSAGDCAARIVGQLLARANAHWCTWASLSAVLPLLAEAAPDAFLSGVRDGLAGESPVLLALLKDQASPPFSSCPHAGLLWALETLAWSPDYLGQVALLLARLARIGPGSTWANSPQASLCAIFRPWFPQTQATVQQRLRVLDMLRQREPEIAWRLLVSLLPEIEGVAINSERPHWREWVTEQPKPVTDGYQQVVQPAVERLLDDVGGSGAHWQDLIHALPMLPPEQREAVIERLASTSPDSLQVPDQSLIWNGLREFVSDHRSFPDAHWALPKACVDRLCEMLRQLEPEDEVARFAWLFSYRPKRPEGRAADWRGEEEVVAEARGAAARAVYERAGLAGILAMVDVVKAPRFLGLALGSNDLATDDEDRLLQQCLVPNDGPQSQFCQGYVTGRIRGLGREWAEKRLADMGEWHPAQQAQLLAWLPCDARTLDLVESLEPETRQWYWRLVFPGAVDNPDVERVMRALIQHGRPSVALQIPALDSHQEDIPVRLIADALEAVLRSGADEVLTLPGLGYEASILLKVVSSSEVIDEERAAALEWGYLTLLDSSMWQPELLHDRLARDPGFFAGIVQMAHQSEGEKAASPPARGRAKTLLQSWRMVPGMGRDGTVDGDELKDWVQRARQELAASGCLAVGDHEVGLVLSGSPHGDDGAWPHPAVREIIDDAASARLELGIEAGLHRSRGVVSREMGEGGAQERQLGERYDDYAAAVSDQWPRAAAMLRRIAGHYRGEARLRDQEAEIEVDLGF